MSIPGRRLPDLFDSVVLVLFTVLSLWTVFILLSQQGPDRIWTGTNGAFIGDQMQYLGWIHSSHGHLLVGNPFETSGGIRDYFNPGLLISGLLVDAGVSTSVSYLVWTPIAALVLGIAVWAYVGRALPQMACRRIALVLALFYLSPLPFIASHLHWNAFFFNSYASEMWPTFYLWGYPLTALAVAFQIGSLLTLERDRDQHKFRWACPVCALFCGLLQPWQGATLILVVVGTEAYLRRRAVPRTNPALLVATVTAAAIPLLYYFLLARFDETWRLAGQVNGRTPEPVRDLLLTFLPLGLFALLAYVRRPRNVEALTAYVWPMGALAVFAVVSVTHGTSADHALQGISTPVSILAVLGVGVLRKDGLVSRMSIAVTSAVVAVLVIIPVADQLNMARNLGKPTILGAEPFFIQPSESQALAYLATSPQQGAVLSTIYLGQIVPAETGRNTWVGITSWTPAISDRVEAAERLFAKQMSQSQAIALIRSSGVRFLLSDCSHREDLSSILKPILQSTIRFGCATVYVVDPQQHPANSPAGDRRST